MARSLTSRIVALSIFWIILALLATAWLLSSLYRDHVAEHYDAHVFTHLEELVAAVETGPDGDPALARYPTDPRFYRRYSGWYWQLQQEGRVLEKSRSLADRELQLDTMSIGEDYAPQVIAGPGGQTLRAQVINVSYAGGTGSLTFMATAPAMQIIDDVKDFATHIALSFLVLGLALAAAVVTQVNVALRPLRAIGTTIGEIRAGKAERLPDEFPRDVQPLVDELNRLLDHNATLLKRARDQLGDLAHSVKNPLAVIRNEARNLPSKEGQLILDQSHAIASSIDHYLTRARMYGHKDAIGHRTAIRPVIEDLRFAMGQLHHEREIDIRPSELEGQCFRGEAQDLEEMVGNLLDNACKWARTQVLLRCSSEGERMQLTVEDDGPGIGEQERLTVLQRGFRLDESRPGHGQGLGIVADLAQLYGGSLQLDRSSLGGLKATLELPAVGH